MVARLFQRVGYADAAAHRMQLRYNHVIEPIQAELAGARVLDLASHDGRWPYLFAMAGAAAVEGIEGRAELVEQFQAYPDDAAKACVTLHVGDLFDHLDRRYADGARFDVVGVLGVLYHVMDHWRLLLRASQLGPRLIVIDSEFALKPWPHVQVIREKTDHPLNAVSDLPMVPKGVPSTGALEIMADALGFDVHYIDWDDVPEEDRKHVAEYFREEKRIRRTCVLRRRA